MFLHYAEVPFENNFGERSIRGEAIMSKSRFNNCSEKGALTQSVLMSVFLTIQRGFNPANTIKRGTENLSQNRNPAPSQKILERFLYTC
jgi:hypothetical protein